MKVKLKRIEYYIVPIYNEIEVDIEELNHIVKQEADDEEEQLNLLESMFYFNNNKFGEGHDYFFTKENQYKDADLSQFENKFTGSIIIDDDDNIISDTRTIILVDDNTNIISNNPVNLEVSNEEEEYFDLKGFIRQKKLNSILFDKKSRD